MGFPSFLWWTVSHYMCMQHLYYPFICKWTLRLFPHLRYFEKCHSEYECSILTSVPLDKYPSDVGLLDYMVVLFFIFWETSVQFSVVVVPARLLIHRPAMYKGCLFSIPCQHSSSLMFFDDSQCEVLSYYGFALHSLLFSDVGHLFMYLLVFCISFFENYLFNFFVHF